MIISLIVLLALAVAAWYRERRQRIVLENQVKVLRQQDTELLDSFRKGILRPENWDASILHPDVSDD